MNANEINEQIDTFVEALGFDDDGYAVLFNEDTGEYEYVEDEDTLELVESLLAEGIIEAPVLEGAYDEREALLQEAYEAGLEEGLKTLYTAARHGGLQGAKKNLQRSANRFAASNPGIANSLRNVRNKLGGAKSAVVTKVKSVGSRINNGRNAPTH